jgi:hypothetical protein
MPTGLGTLTPKAIFPTLWEIPNMSGTLQTIYEDLRKKSIF